LPFFSFDQHLTLIESMHSIDQLSEIKVVQTSGSSVLRSFVSHNLRTFDLFISVEHIPAQHVSF
jgi:hypothetical protein